MDIAMSIFDTGYSINNLKKFNVSACYDIFNEWPFSLLFLLEEKLTNKITLIVLTETIVFIDPQNVKS